MELRGTRSVDIFSNYYKTFKLFLMLAEVDVANGSEEYEICILLNGMFN